jgi:hypothetical protein
MTRAFALVLLLLAAVLWTVLVKQAPVLNNVERARPSTLAPPPSRPAVKFPLRVAPNRRFLEDSEGKPFLVKGDSAWSLVTQLKREDVDVYLRDRRSRGFNTILVSLIEHYFATHAPANAYGDQPFMTPGNFDTPNEAYFSYADWVIQRAYDEGFLVLLAPSYAGASGGHEGWYREMVANGTAKLRDYGRYVGRRYSRFPNIIWVENGDYNPPKKELARAVAEGIHETDPSALHTAHNATGTPGIDLWATEPWLQLNNVYTWGPIFPDARAQYLWTPRFPFILIESKYENEPGIAPQRLRAQAYQALLTGAAGHVFGNYPIWYFDGTSDYPGVPSGWRKALPSVGARSMSHLHGLFAHLPWQDLKPDVDNTFLVTGQGTGHGRAVAALAGDRSTAVVYIPDDRTIRLNLSRLAGRHLRARWFDPSNGAIFDVAGSPLQIDGIQRFRPSVKNAEGAGDWVLLLDVEKP